MGCSGSKDSEKDQKIDSDFQELKMAKFDEIFSKASDILKVCEDIRSGLADNRGDGEEVSGTELLKEGKYTDTLNVLLWTFSAAGKGKIMDVKLAITNDSPYIDVDCSLLTADTNKLYDSFTNYAKVLVETPGKMKDAVDSLVELVKLIPQALSDAKNEIANLDFKAKIEAISKMNKNANKLPRELKKCQQIYENLKTAALDLKEVIPKLPEMVKQADEIGAKAHAAGLKDPKEIFLKFHTGERKVEEKKAEKK